MLFTQPPPHHSAGSAPPRFTRADIARLAAQDAEYGLRYVPPQPYLQMPLLPHFMPPLYTNPEDDPPTNQPPPPPLSLSRKTSQAGSVLGRSRSGSITSVSTRAPSEVLSQSQPRASVRAAAARKAAALEEMKKTKGGKSLSASARTSRQTSKHATPLLQPQPAPAVNATPIVAPISNAPSIAASPLDNHPALSFTAPAAAPRTPRGGSQANSRAGSRMGSPRGGNTPRGARSRSLLRNGGSSSSGNLSEGDVRSMVQTLLQEELTRVAAAETRARADEVDRADTRALRHDLVWREEEERRRRLEEETHRPNYYLHQAKAEVRELGQQILPLLEQADSALQRLYSRTGVSERMSASLLQQLSSASAQTVANHADQLGDLILDHLLGETITTLNAIELQKEADHQARLTSQHVGNAWELLERVEAEREEIERRWVREREREMERKQHMPKDLSPVKSAAASSTQLQQQQQPSAHFLPPSSHLPASSLPSRLDRPASPQRSYSSHATHSSFPISSPAGPPKPANTMQALQLISDRAGPSPPSQPLVSLPILPGLVTSLQDQQREYTAWRAARSREQFLHSSHLPLHSIVAAAGDDVFDELLTQAVEEVGSICDGYVERVFEAEFALDLEQMAEQDVAEQMQHQRQEDRQQEQED